MTWRTCRTFYGTAKPPKAPFKLRGATQADVRYLGLKVKCHSCGFFRSGENDCSKWGRKLAFFLRDSVLHRFVRVQPKVVVIHVSEPLVWNGSASADNLFGSPVVKNSGMGEGFEGSGLSGL